MQALRPYCTAVVVTATPATIFAATLGYTTVTALSLGSLVVAASLFPATTRRAVVDSLEALKVLAALALVVATLAAGMFVFLVGATASAVWAMGVGAAFTLMGVAFARRLSPALRPEPVPVLVIKPPVPAPPRVIERIVYVEPPPPPLPPPPPKPREVVLWGAREFPAARTDEHFYVISGPPGMGKSVLFKLFMLPIVAELLETEEGCRRLVNDTRLIVFEPKHEIYAWLASIWPKDTLAPLRLMLLSDERSVMPDLNRDYRTMTDAETFSHALFPEDPADKQKFFPDSLRTLVAMAITAIRIKLGFWTLRILVLVLSNPGYLRHLVGGNECTKFAKELLSKDSGETAQNVQMTITSKLLKYRLLAAHFERAKKNPLSLEQFLAEPGVLVVSRDGKYPVQHDNLNGVLINRIGQIIEQLQQDPARRRRTYFLLDEFPVLAGNKPVPGIVDMFLRLRSLGVVFLITFQTYATLKRVYQDQADEILNTTRNFIILGSGDPTDAKHQAELIGKIRGYEAQRNKSTTEGENEGTSDATNESETKGESESWGGQRSTTTSPQGQSLSDGTNWSKSENKSKTRGTGHTKSRGRSYSTTEGATWVWYDREIKSPTELMRMSPPESERGIGGVAYRVGEPAPWQFTYEWTFIKKQVHDRNPFIEEYIERKEKEEILDELTREELRALDLLRASPKDDGLWAQPGQADEGAAKQSAPDDSGDWDKTDPDKEGDDPCSPDDFLNDQ